MKEPLISVVIPNWNGLKLLKVCLSSLKKQTFRDFEVIIVDNGSEDNSIEYIKNFYTKVKVISLEKNYGFSKAANEGIKNSKGKYIFLLNNDTELEKNCLKYLVNRIKDPKIFFVTPKFLNFYKRDRLELAGNSFVIDVVGHLFSTCDGKRDSQRYNQPGYTFLASGGGSLFKRNLFDKVGSFDEDYFFYMEDADFCLRAQWQGFKGWFEPRARIYHMRMATSSKMRERVEYLVFRNMMVTVIKNFPLRIFVKNFNFLKIILVNINTIRYLIFKGLFWEALKAEAYILFNLPIILKKRENIQKNKKVTDQYIIDNILDKKITLPKL